MYFNVQVGGCGYVYQCIEFEQVDFVLYQVGDMWLSYFEEFGGLGLVYFCVGEVVFECCYEDGMQFYVFCFFWSVFDGILDVGKLLFVYCFNFFNKIVVMFCG